MTDEELGAPLLKAEFTEFTEFTERTERTEFTEDAEPYREIDVSQCRVDHSMLTWSAIGYLCASFSIRLSLSSEPTTSDETMLLYTSIAWFAVAIIAAIVGKFDNVCKGIVLHALNASLMFGNYSSHFSLVYLTLMLFNDFISPEFHVLALALIDVAANFDPNALDGNIWLRVWLALDMSTVVCGLIALAVNMMG